MLGMAVLLLCLPGCKRSPTQKRVLLSRLQLRGQVGSVLRMSGWSRHRLTREIGQALVREAPVRPSWLAPARKRPARPAKKGRRVRLRFSLARTLAYRKGPPGKRGGRTPVLLVGVSCWISPSSTNTEPVMAAGAAMARPSSTGGISRAEVSRALRSSLKDAARRVKALLALDSLTQPELLKRLGDQDPRIRVTVVRRIALFKGPTVTRLLILALKDKKLAVRMAAVGVLGRRKARSAVPALIALAGTRSRGVTTQVQYALAAIGGEKAEAFLLVMSSGHPDPKVRRGASEALAELRRHRTPGPNKGSAR